MTTGITFGCANLISITATIGTSYKPSAGKTLGIYAALLVSHGMINSFGVYTLRFFNNASVILHSLGITSFAVAVLAKAPVHQSAKFVFATFVDETGDPGWSVRASPAYSRTQPILLPLRANTAGSCCVWCVDEPIYHYRVGAINFKFAIFCISG